MPNFGSAAPSMHLTTGKEEAFRKHELSVALVIIYHVKMYSHIISSLLDPITESNAIREFTRLRVLCLGIKQTPYTDNPNCLLRLYLLR